MKRYAIPTILIATIMVAGIFALVPIEQASTVHTTVQGLQAQIQADEDLTDLVAAANDDVARVTISTSNNDPFVINSLVVCATSTNDDDNGGNTLEVSIESIIMDDDTMEGVDGAPLAPGTIIEDGTIAETTCVDALEALVAANADFGGLIMSDGADVIIDFELEGNGDDEINSVKAVAIVDGSSTLSVVSSLP